MGPVREHGPDGPSDARQKSVCARCVRREAVCARTATSRFWRRRRRALEGRCVEASSRALGMFKMYILVACDDGKIGYDDSTERTAVAGTNVRLPSTSCQ